MQILPVLDLLNGRVVHGIQGQRESYQPITSQLTAGSAALEIARAIRSAFGFHSFYVADLNAIQHAKDGSRDQTNATVLRELIADGFQLMVDAGIRTTADANTVTSTGASFVIAALETLPGPQVLREIVAQLGTQSIVFSLDLQRGEPLVSGDDSAWPRDPFAIAEQALACGCRKMIVLDLNGVGANDGVPTIDFCQQLRARFHHDDFEVITGGGVRGIADLRALSEAGIDGCLIASAIHNGSITPRELETAGFFC